MTEFETLALAGAVGGAGTTRIALESGATLARAGYDAALLDAAFATQGLADYLSGHIKTDLTAVLAEDLALEAAMVTVVDEPPGRLRAAPARAPFERLARAKTAGAARRFEECIVDAAATYDVVLVDVPPIAANQAVAAVDTCEGIAAVAPDTIRGADGLARLRGRLRDLDVAADTIVATFAGDERVITGATAAIPPVPAAAPADCPTTVSASAPLGPPVAAFLDDVLGVDLSLEFEPSSRFGRLLPGER